MALAQVEANGFRVDVPYLREAMHTTKARIRRLENKLRGCKEYHLQRRRYGQDCSLGSRDQLAAVLYGDMGYTPGALTSTGKPQLDETALDRVGSKYARGFLRLEKLNKLYGTYLQGLWREVEGDRVHAFFGLHLVRSFRGQSDGPNMQNQPVRDPVQGDIIRRCFIPSPGHAIVEQDYSSLEVMVACALSGDKKLMYDATEGDMHRDMAAECFMLDPGQVTKATRQATKGDYVFSQFYGDWYMACARNLWDDVQRQKLATVDGVGLYEHLASKGITELGATTSRDPRAGTFAAHIKKVEDRFWNQRFRTYHAWRQKQVADYYANGGYIDLVTGFRCRGPMEKNQIINYPIQGPAFHCTLWSLTQLVREIRRRRMGAKVVCQIHDSIVADVPLDEVPTYVELCREIMCERIREHWRWITVPLEAEAEVATTCWADKGPYSP